jgi:hypothetical protein
MFNHEASGGNCIPHSVLFGLDSGVISPTQTDEATFPDKGL